MAETWLALSDRDPATDASSELVEAGLLVVELNLPLTSATVLLDFQSASGWPRTITLFHDPAAGLVLVHRQGQCVARHALAGPLAQFYGTGRLSLRFDAPGRVWDMRLDYIGQQGLAPLFASGRNPLPMRTEDLHALSRGAARVNRSPAVLWFGLTRGADLPAKAPWIGQRTPIETPRGPVMAGRLVAGDMVSTADGGLVTLRRVVRMDLPACGSFAPVILRAPFFAESNDILVSSDQCVALSGPEVEYLFDVDVVLAQAGALVDGRTALAEQRRAVASVLLLEFDVPALLVADGSLLLAGRPGAQAPCPVLQSYEVLTLMALLGRSGHRRVA